MTTPTPTPTTNNKNDGARRGTRWAFTINNWTEDEQQQLRGLVGLQHGVRYIIWGRERGDNGTPHLQGYLELHDKKRLGGVKALPGMARSHLELARLAGTNNIEYCKKGKGEDEWEEYGEQRADNPGSTATAVMWEHVWASARRGDFDSIPARIRLVHAAGIRAVWEEAQWEAARPARFDLELRPWQADMARRLDDEPDDRTVVVVVDKTGGKGKTKLGAYLEGNRPDDVQVLRPGQHKDLAKLVRPRRLYIFDCQRNTGDRIPWEFIESLKDGFVQSTKYEPVIRRMKTPHVWVFTNQDPDYTALSADRFIVVDLEGQ